MNNILDAHQIVQADVPTSAGQFKLGDQTFTILSALRHLAGRRSTFKVQAQNDGQLLVVKLFTAHGKGLREFERELAAHAHCQTHDINVAPLYQHWQNLNAINAIAYMYLPDARTLGELAIAQQPLDKLFLLFAKCHQADCYQDDPHLDNFVLAQNGELYLVDLASVVVRRRTLHERLVLKNLAKLQVQWPVRSQSTVNVTLATYFNARQWALTSKRQARLATYYRRARKNHQRHYLSKQLRRCTMTVYVKTRWQESAWRKSRLRDYPDIAELEQRVEQGQPLKQGHSATVSLSTLENQAVVVKRYNIKSFRHWLSRCWRPSRARVSWINANLLTYSDIRTPAPIGFVEKRWWGLRRQAYFVSEYVPGRLMGTISAAALKQPPMQAQIKALFGSLRAQCLIHGDLKASNLLVDAQGQIWLIDLDALRQVSARRFQRLHEQDRQRFMRNWANNEAVINWLDSVTKE